MKAEEIVERVRAALEDKQGRDIAVVDVRDVSGITDYYVIASGSTPPHLKALLNGVHQSLKEAGLNAYRKTTDPESRWLVLDYVDVIVHIMDAEARAYYAIEDLWTGQRGQPKA